MLKLYNTALLPLRALSAPWAAWDGRRPARAVEWAERRARVLPVVPPGGLWVHGSSVGEARIVGTVVRGLRELQPGLPMSVSSFTRTGRQQLPAPPDADAAFFVPLDFPGLPGRLLDAIRCAALVLVETELWPNLLHESRQRGTPVVLINGRLSAERMSRYRRLGGLYRPLLEGLARVGAQSESDARRFLELGVRPEALSVTGNVKYDLPRPRVDPAALRSRFGLDDDRPVVVAGSTGPGEEELVLRAFERARAEHPALFLILAPRHPERAVEVDRLAASRKLRLHRLSHGDGPSAAAADGLLVDTIGELAALYSICRAAFVGGSLVPIGGHNVLEPAAAGAPVLFGPHTQHFAEPAEELVRSGGGFRVRDAGALAARWIELVGEGDFRRRASRSAAEVLRANRGAMQRSLSMILSVLEGHAA